MKRVTESYIELIHALHTHAIVVFDGLGHWEKVSACRQFFLRATFIDRFYYWNALQALIDQFDTLEQIPVQFNSGSADVRFTAWMQVAEAFLATLPIYIPAVLLNKLEQRIIGLKYRLEESNGGLDPVKAIDENILLMRQYAAEWKRLHPLIGEPLISPQEFSLLRQVAEYPAFIELIKKSPQIRESFLTWVLQDENAIPPFVQYPATVERITLSSLSGRIGRLGSHLLQISKGLIKVLTLPFEGRPHSILDPQALIHFRGGYTLSIADIFSIFKNKTIDPGNLEFMQEGIVNWSSHFLGYWDAFLKMYIKIDVDQPNWWEQMPVYETFTRKQLMKRYGMDLKPRQWVIAPTATRGRPNLDYEETHAYLEVAIPNSKGQYSIYDFGKLAVRYPKSFIEKLMMFTEVVHATVAYPDDNVFLTQRQTGFQPYAVNGMRGSRLMDNIKEDILHSRGSNFVYQIESENCAKWVYKKLEAILGKDHLPDLFRMQLLDTEPQGPVAHLFSWIKKLPARWQVPVLTHLHLPLGAMREVWIEEDGQRVAKSLATHTFFDTGQIYLPALLISKIVSNQLSYGIHSGIAYGKEWLKLMLGRLGLYTARANELFSRTLVTSGLRRLALLWSRYYEYDQNRQCYRGLLCPKLSNS